MFDWDKIVVEVDNNVVDLTAGEVALLIAADADTVTWGNITGDMAQQADLMLELDSKIDVDSPEFTGTPRTPTPPAGNSSTRIANTKFVNDAINAVIPNGGFGDLAGKDKVDFYTDIINKPQNMPSNFGTLASKSYVDYRTDVTYKPTLGALASKDTVNYTTEVTNKPTLGTLASKNTVNYETEVTNKPVIPEDMPSSFGTLASKNSVDYATEVTNKPTLGSLASKNSVDYETEVYNKPTSNSRNEFYVDKDNGDDNNDGTSDHPFKTIQKAVDSISITGYINLMSSYYYGHIEVNGKSIHFYNRTNAQIDLIGLSAGDTSVINVCNNGFVYLPQLIKLHAVVGWPALQIEEYSSVYCWSDLSVLVDVDVQSAGVSGIYVDSGSEFICKGNLTVNVNANVRDWKKCVTAEGGSTVILDSITVDCNVMYVFESDRSFIKYRTVTAHDNAYTYLSNILNGGIVRSYAEDNFLYNMQNKVYLYVDGTNGDDSGDGSNEHPFKTIQKAIDAVAPFSKADISIQPGEYVSGSLLIDYRKNITFYSSGYLSQNPETVIIKTYASISPVTLGGTTFNIYEGCYVNFSGFFHFSSDNTCGFYAESAKIDFTAINNNHSTYTFELRNSQSYIQYCIVAKNSIINFYDDSTLVAKNASSTSTVMQITNCHAFIDTIKLLSNFQSVFACHDLGEVYYDNVNTQEGSYSSIGSTSRGGKITQG